MVLYQSSAVRRIKAVGDIETLEPPMNVCKMSGIEQ